MSFQELEQHHVFSLQPPYRSLDTTELSLPLQARADAMSKVLDIVEGLEQSTCENLKSRTQHRISLVSGFHGIGKTRLAHELCDRMKGPSGRFERCSILAAYNHSCPPVSNDQRFTAPSRLALRLLYSALVDRQKVSFQQFCESFTKQVGLTDALRLVLQHHSRKHGGRPISMVVTVDGFQVEADLVSVLRAINSFLVAYCAPHRVHFVFFSLLELPLYNASNISQVHVNPIRLQPLSFADALTIAQAWMEKHKATPFRYESSYLSHLFACASVPLAFFYFLDGLSSRKDQTQVFADVSKSMANKWSAAISTGNDSGTLHRIYASSVTRANANSMEMTRWADAGLCHIVSESRQPDRVVMPHLLMREWLLGGGLGSNLALRPLEKTLRYLIATDNWLGQTSNDSDQSERLDVFGHAIMLQSQQLLQPERKYLSLPEVLPEAHLSKAATRIEVPVVPVEIYEATAPQYNSKSKTWLPLEPDMFTGDKVVKFPRSEALFDCMVVFRGARRGKEKFDLVLLDQRNLACARSLEYALIEAGLKHGEALCTRLREEKLLENPRVLFGVASAARHVSDKCLKRLRGNNDAFAFAMGAEEFKRHYEYIPSHPLISPFVFINIKRQNEQNELVLALPRKWSKREQRAKAILAVRDKTGCIPDVQALCAAARLADSEAPLELDPTERLAIDFTQWKK